MITRHMSTAPDRWSPCTPSPGAPVAEGGARARPPRPHGRSACRARRGTRAAPRSRVRSSTCRVEVMTPHGPRDALRLPSRRPGRAPRRTGPRKTSQCVVHRLRRAGANLRLPLPHGPTSLLGGGASGFASPRPLRSSTAPPTQLVQYPGKSRSANTIPQVPDTPARRGSGVCTLGCATRDMRSR